MSRRKGVLKSGIYLITCIPTNKHYVGYSTGLRDRIAEHKRLLRLNKHLNEHLQNAFNLYGINNFLFEVLEEHPEELLPSMEHYWCLMLNTHNREYGYNIKPTDPNAPCVRTSEETKIKISKGKFGYKHSLESIIKIKEARARQVITEEHKRKIAEYHTGKKWGPIKESARIKMRNAKLGKKQDPEVVIKRSMSLKGRVCTEEHRKKTSEKLKGNKNGLGSSRGAILQLDMNGTLIKEWPSMTSIVIEMKCNYSNLSNCCNNKKVSYKNYIWKFKNK